MLTIIQILHRNASSLIDYVRMSNGCFAPFLIGFVFLVFRVSFYFVITGSWSHAPEKGEFVVCNRLTPKIENSDSMNATVWPVNGTSLKQLVLQSPVPKESVLFSSNQSSNLKEREYSHSTPFSTAAQPTPVWSKNPSLSVSNSRARPTLNSSQPYTTTKPRYGGYGRSFYPYRGTASRIRYTASDSTIRLYPGNEHSLSIHPSSDRSKTQTLCGRKNSKMIRNKYLRQYRDHKRVTSFRSPTNDTILIIVNYHFSHYKSVSFFDSTYFPAFAQLYPLDFDVVYIGANCNQYNKVLKNAYTKRGHYSYHSFRLVYDLFPQEKYPYGGYLFMNDDSFVDPQFLSSYDLSKSWIEPSIAYNGRMRWPWNSALNVHRVSYSEAFYNAMDEIMSDPSIARRCSYTRPGALRKGWGDFFYINRADVSFFLTLEEVMFRHRVFLEMAVPTIIHCVNPEPFIDCNHGRMEDRLHCVHVHPVKLSQSYYRSYMMKRLKHKNMYEIPIMKYCVVWLESHYSYGKEIE